MDVPKPTKLIRQYRKRGGDNENMICNICHVEKPNSAFKSYRHQCTECFNIKQSNNQKIRVLRKQCRDDLKFKLTEITKLLSVPP